MKTKNLIYSGISFIVLLAIINTGIFVSFQDMQAYAVSKDSFSLIMKRLDTIEDKLEKMTEIILKDKDHFY